MSGIDAVSARIAEIQSRLIAMQTQTAATTSAARTAGTAGTTATTNASGGGTFATALADAVATTRATAAPTATRVTSATLATSATSATSRISAINSSAPSSTSAITGPAPAQGYRLNAKGIPTDLAAYGNGKIPGSALERVGNRGHKLWSPAAHALTKMRADAKAAGVKIGITDSYRSYAEQVDVARRKGLYSQGGLAAKPGTSEHGWGMAADLDLNSKALSWMRANGEKYGFVENTPREPWHWAYKAKR